jgi:hypothetical protein
MIQTVIVNDFTGGLNYRADAFQLANNESPDMLNVDVDPRGGFSSRGGVIDYSTSAIGGISSLGFRPNKLFAWDGAYKHLLVAANDRVFWTANGTVSSSIATTNNPFGASFSSWAVGASSFVYIACGHSNQGHKWSGTVATALTASGTGQWQDSYAAPTGTHMPKANLVATHIDRLWVADTNENNVAYPNRVRFSHPAIAESWRESDYIDVLGGGNGITALVPFGDQLLIFKRRSVFLLSGYDEETFQLVPISMEIGAANPQCVVATEQGVFFFSWPDGLFVFNGSGFTDLFVPLRPLLRTGEISETAVNGISVSWLDRRLFLSMPIGVEPAVIETYDDTGVTYNSSSVRYEGGVRAISPTSTFVWDSTVKEGGAWTKYQTGDGYAFGPGVDFVQADGSRIPVIAHAKKPVLLKTCQEGTCRDRIAGTSYSFEAYYYTKWQDAEATTSRKFWRRPEMVVRQTGFDTVVNVEVYHDWNRSDVAKSFNIQLDARDIGGGYNSWVQPDLGSDLAKGNNLGLANSVQLKISSSGTGPWGINSISFKYNPRRVRV